MNLPLLGSSLDMVGKVMIAYTAIAVHYRFWQEHRIDEKVFVEMRKERVVGIVGIVFIVLGYLLQLPSKL